MTFVNLLNKSLIVTIGLMMLLSGIVLYYCGSRFLTLEKAVQRQNQVLAEFITNVRSEFHSGITSVQNKTSSHLINDSATQEAIKSAEKYYEDKNISLSLVNKIEVSDDDTSSSSSDTDNSDTDSDIEVDEDSTAPQMTNVMSSTTLNDDMNIKVIAMSGECNIELSDITQLLGKSFNSSVVNPMITELDELEVVSSDSDDSDDDDIDNKLNLVKVDKKDPFEMLINLSAPNVNNIDYKKMNVTALRELLVERGLSSEPDSRKMKKNELIDALCK